MIRALAAGLFVLLATDVATAQSYPTRPVQMIIGSAVGGAPDLVGRALAEGMAATLGQPVVVVNREGAGMTIGAAAVLQAPPDGYVVGFSGTGPFISQPHLRDLPYRATDVEFVCQAFELQVALAVHRDSTVRTLADLIAAARTAPGRFAVGHTGPASIPHIAVAQLETAAGIQINHIAYRGDGPLLQNLLGRHVDAGAIGLGSIGQNDLRVLAIFGTAREPMHPNVPTLTELGYPVVLSGMSGLYVPKGLPAPVRAALDRACAAGMESAPVRAVSQRLNQPMSYLPGAQWTARLDAASAANKAVIDRLGLKSQQ